jgi:hypothetical protein
MQEDTDICLHRLEKTGLEIHQFFHVMGTGSNQRGRNVELSYIYIVLRLRMRGALPPALTFMPLFFQLYYLCTVHSGSG